MFTVSTSQTRGGRLGMLLRFLSILCHPHGKQPEVASTQLHLCCRLYADQLAAEGFFVFLPDIFHGDALREGWDKTIFMEWMQKHPQEMQVNQLDRLLTDMHQQYKPKSVSCIGFCWGGRHACMLANSDKVSSAVVAHGSFITKEVVEAVTQPMLFLFADKVLTDQRLQCGCQLCIAAA